MKNLRSSRVRAHYRRSSRGRKPEREKDQIDLFTPGQPLRLSRRSRTQFDAQATAKPRAEGARRKILDYLRSVWPGTPTRPEIAQALAIKVNTVNGRIAELRSARYFPGSLKPPVYETGKRDGCACLAASRSHPLSLDDACKASRYRSAR